MQKSQVESEISRLPPDWIIVEDGAPENKNKNRLWWYAFLVKNDKIRSVQLIYFLTGHSHWKCDQSFGVLSKALDALDGCIANITEFREFLLKS